MHLPKQMHLLNFFLWRRGGGSFELFRLRDFSQMTETFEVLNSNEQLVLTTGLGGYTEAICRSLTFQGPDLKVSGCLEYKQCPAITYIRENIPPKS